MTYPVYRNWRTPNFSRNQYGQPLTNRLLGIVLHHTGGSLAGALSWLTNSKSQVSAHNVIDTDGTRYVLAPPELVTWHSGHASMQMPDGRIEDWCNSFCYGIEFVGDTNVSPLTQQQVDSWVQCYQVLINMYPRLAEPGRITDHRTADRLYAERHGKASGKVDLHPNEFARCLNAVKHLHTNP